MHLSRRTVFEAEPHLAPCFLFLALVGALALGPDAHAQGNGRPTPRLGYAYPAGGQQGTTVTVYLGGHDFELNDLRIEFNSPYFRAIPGSIKRHDLGEKLSAVSFLLAVDEEVPSGVYSLFLTGNDGILTAMVGGLKVSLRQNL